MNQLDKNGKLIKEGDTIIHTNFPDMQRVVYVKDGELFAGFVKVGSYHSSVLEVVNEQNNR